MKSLYLKLAKSKASYLSNVEKKLWHGLVPHIIEIFLWLVLMEKLNTREKMARLNIILESENVCILCK